jgi:uncharacterized membrane protein YvlD (DUF360 family)
LRFLLRWLANALTFYLALYLVDTLIAPRFWIKTVWIAPVLAVSLALLNSLVRPLPRVKDKPSRALAVAAATIIVNALVIQIFLWIGSPLSTTSIVWVLVTAVFLSILGGVINWLVGFKPKEEPKVITQELREKRAARESDERAPRTRS